MVLEAMSDYDLVEQTKQGQSEAFSVLVKRYRQPLIHLCQRYVGDPYLAEDLVQDSFIKAFEKLASFEFRSAFKSWLYRIAINTAKNSLRSKKPTTNIDDVVITVENETENDLIDRQLLSQAQEIIETLPLKQRQAVNLRVFSDQSFKQVAAKMDCPYDTAKANYRHGLIKLREQMVITW